MDKYQSTLEYLYNCLPVFQHTGASAYKPGLERVTQLSEAFGAPHKELRCIHVAGTNGKGSTAHTLAAVLQSAGYKTGLFTSPHLEDFRERIRVDGEMISEDAVIDFTSRFRAMDIDCEPSFFELTTVMAFEHFVRNHVDVAVIEVGLGGRLDSTNIISPTVSIITNISLDHTGLLGNTLEQIAMEKAGIIKPGVPTVVGEADGSVRDVFVQSGQRNGVDIVFAEDEYLIKETVETSDGNDYNTVDYGRVHGELTGHFQYKNALTILAALRVLTARGLNISAEAVRSGFNNVCKLTGLRGRWMTLSTNPLVVCDTGHNPAGWQEIVNELLRHSQGTIHMVVGFVSDKDVAGILRLMTVLPNARYYFSQPSLPRALNVETLQEMAIAEGLDGEAYPTIKEAYENALGSVAKGDMIFVGGSNFVVSEIISMQ